MDSRTSPIPHRLPSRSCVVLSDAHHLLIPSQLLCCFLVSLSIPLNGETVYNRTPVFSRSLTHHASYLYLDYPPRCIESYRPYRYIHMLREECTLYLRPSFDITG
ncbi:hypothetical protein JAAARDRAFT_493050 [Jaapia argillacea MUCL 33604]|uniref:Uncharacterized protein n=1 Tax=Jaapia argillacea MUCL 33604 TaxID=933084 RepID=A0A067PNV7_9AGAM|nr:hypothetical protein JAAARDRAFT_493050 [Jaapia argillacea MUCL 33604]